MSEKTTPKLDELVDSLVPDLQPEVAKIEASLPTTRNHYGRYMSIITTLANGNKMVGMVVAIALKKAGANAQGVNDALRVSF